MDILEILTTILVFCTAVGLGFAGYQMWLVNKQVRGEVYKTAKIKNLRFFLPDKRAHITKGFENIQNEHAEVDLGKEIEVKSNSNLECFNKFVFDAPQRLRVVTLGFTQNKDDGSEYEGHPVISTYKSTFKEKEISNIGRDIYMDWHQHWHVEFPFSRFFAKEDCVVLCFEIDTKSVGIFPLDFEIITEEAKVQYKERLWVKVVN